jgi:hypothetical protein
LEKLFRRKRTLWVAELLEQRRAQKWKAQECQRPSTDWLPTDQQLDSVSLVMLARE